MGDWFFRIIQMKTDIDLLASLAAPTVLTRLFTERPAGCVCSWSRCWCVYTRMCLPARSNKCFAAAEAADASECKIGLILRCTAHWPQFSPCQKPGRLCGLCAGDIARITVHAPIRQEGICMFFLRCQNEERALQFKDILNLLAPPARQFQIFYPIPLQHFFLLSSSAEFEACILPSFCCFMDFWYDAC